VQDLILSAVAGQRFMVGDVKQSIYRFRRANPGLFVDKYRNFTSYDIMYKNSDDMQSYIHDSANERENLRIDLSQNFRSRAGVLDAVNFFFSQLMCEEVGEVSYDIAAALHVGADYPLISEETFPGMWVELLDQPTSEPDTDEQEEEPVSAIIAETRMIAACIHEAIATRQVWDKDKNEYRSCNLGDIVILARSANTLATDVIEELKVCGIDAVAEVTAAFYQQLEVKTALAFLRITDNPRQDIDLIAALSSPAYGVTPDELLMIKQCTPGESDMLNGGGTLDETPCQTLIDKPDYEETTPPKKRRSDFYDHMIAFASSHNIIVNNNLIPFTNDIAAIPGHAPDERPAANNDILAKIRRFLHDLGAWRKAATHLPVSRLIGLIFETTNYPSHAASMPGGEIRQANLRLLLERAIEFEETSFKGLFHFIQYIEGLYSTDSAQRISGAVAPSQDLSNRVRFMSIHKSKGLEFPVVIVGYLGKAFNLNDERQPIILHGGQGLGPKYVNLQKRTRSRTLAHYALARLTRQENLSEELRCLYVAMTRAKELLILTGRTAHWESDMQKWSDAAASPDNLPSIYYRQSAGKYLDWIMPCLLRHRDGESQADQDADVHSNRKIYEHPARFDIRIHHGLVQFDAPAVESTFIPSVEQPAPPNLVTASPLPSKLSISEIKRLYSSDISPDSTPHQDPPPTFDPPDFIREKEGLTPMVLGSAFHTIAEHIDFAQHTSPEAINQLITQLQAKNLLTQEAAAAIDIRKITTLAVSPMADRIRNAKNVYRETPFVMAIPATELYPYVSESSESVLVHGIIDCYFEESDGLVLVDFKSESPGHDPATWANVHKTQLSIYKKAIEEAADRHVKEVMLYSFAAGKAISVPI